MASGLANVLVEVKKRRHGGVDIYFVLYPPKLDLTSGFLLQTTLTASKVVSLSSVQSPQVFFPPSWETDIGAIRSSQVVPTWGTSLEHRCHKQRVSTDSVQPEDVPPRVVEVIHEGRNYFPFTVRLGDDVEMVGSGETVSQNKGLSVRTADRPRKPSDREGRNPHQAPLRTLTGGQHPGFQAGTKTIPPGGNPLPG